MFQWKKPRKTNSIPTNETIKNQQHTIIKIFTVGHGLLPNKHFVKLSKNVNIYGAHTDANNIHTQRSRYGV